MSESPDDKKRAEIAKNFLNMPQSAGYRDLLMRLRRASFHLSMYYLMELLDKSYNRGVEMGRALAEQEALGRKESH